MYPIAQLKSEAESFRRKLSYESGASKLKLLNDSFVPLSRQSHFLMLQGHSEHTATSIRRTSAFIPSCACVRACVNKNECLELVGRQHAEHLQYCDTPAVLLTHLQYCWYSCSTADTCSSTDTAAVLLRHLHHCWHTCSTADTAAVLLPHLQYYWYTAVLLTHLQYCWHTCSTADTAAVLLPHLQYYWYTAVLLTRLQYCWHNCSTADTPAVLLIQLHCIWISKKAFSDLYTAVLLLLKPALLEWRPQEFLYIGGRQFDLLRLKLTSINRKLKSPGMWRCVFWYALWSFERT